MSTSNQPVNQQSTSEYITAVREGAIAANIFLGESDSGTKYHYFLLSRSWKSTKSGSEGYSDRFFANNAEAIAGVVKAAAAKCDELSGNAEAMLPELTQ